MALDGDLDALLDSCLLELDADATPSTATQPARAAGQTQPRADELIAAGVRAAVSDGGSDEADGPSGDGDGDGDIDKLASMFDDIFKMLNDPSGGSAAAASSSSSSAPGSAPLDEHEAEKLASNLESLLQGLGKEKPAADSSSSSSGGHGEDDDDSLLEGFMECLMSKDVLYQPMKDMLSRYDEYLADGSRQLSAEERGKCVQQRGYVAEIVRVLETTPDDRKRVFELVQQMEQSGQPPPELASSIFPDFSMLNAADPLAGSAPPMPDLASLAQLMGSSASDKECAIC